MEWHYVLAHIDLYIFHILFEEITSFPNKKGTTIQKLK